MLTSAATYRILPLEGGDCMKGSVQFHKPAGRHYISWYPVKIWKNPITREPFWHKRNAEKILDKMRCEDDAGTLLLRSYMPDSPLSLSVVSEDWLKAFTGTQATRKFYRKMIQSAIDYFGADFDIRLLTFSKLQIFYNELPFTIRGKYHRLSTLKNLLHFCQKDALISRIPPFPSLPQGLKEDIRYLTYEQQQSVLQAIPERHRGIFELAMEYGLRIGEVIALQKDCVTDTEITIKRTMSDGELRCSTKTGKVRRYGITEKSAEIIKKIPVHLSPFIFTRSGDRNYTWKMLTGIWRKASKQAGIKINLYNGFRHSLGCQLMDQGVELEMVRDILGHTSTEMTRRYAKRSSAIMTKILEFRGRTEAEKRRSENVQAAESKG
jgi:integrase